MVTVTTQSAGRITSLAPSTAAGRKLRRSSPVRVLATLLVAGGMALIIGTPTHALAADSFDTLIAKASAARKAGELEKTAALLRKAIAIKPAPALLNNLGRVLEDLGDYQGAVDSYTLVANNPNADAGLRALDAARIATLQNKLSKGWIEATLEPSGGQTLVNGRPPAAAKGKEFPVPPGTSNLEFKSFKGGTVAVLNRAFPLGKRTALKIPLTGPLKGWGALTFSGLTKAPRLIKVNGYTLEGLSGLQELRLVAGRHEVTFFFGDNDIVLNLFIKAGQRQDLSADLNKRVAAIAVPPPVKVAPAESSMSPWPYVLIGLGAVAGGVGGFLIADADSDRDDVLEADRDGRGVVTSITLADAQEVQDDADAKATAGVAVIGVGGALLLGGIVWAIVDATSGSEGEGSVDVSIGWGTVGLRGAF